MELSLQTFLIVCPLVFFAGLVDSIAGGGGLIALPAYLMAGLPPHVALGTNKLSSIAGTTMAFVRYYRNRYVDLMLCLPSVAVALAGSALGTSLALLVDEKVVRWVLLAAIPLTAVYVLRHRNFDRPPVSHGRAGTVVRAAAISFVLGTYDGFSGPGTGTFLILLYYRFAGIDIRTANGNAKLINLASNLSAFTLFLLNGRVLIPLGLAAAAFNMLGAFIGSGLVIDKGSRIIRITMLVVLALVMAKMVWDTFFV